ncbi:MAG TPA: hypothetical protein VFS43_46775 [Polyangiaceae bacterium]|nr:hypothetical protein [Polyangiaceae bacterium]
MTPIQNIADFEARLYKAIGTDKRTGGEGPWYFVVQSDRAKIAAFPPPKTQVDTMRGIVAVMGGGRVEAGELDPKDPSKKRRAIVVDAVYQEPGVAEECRGAPPADEDDGPAPAALSEGTGEGGRYPVPAGPPGPGSPPPPAKSGNAEG